MSEREPATSEREPATSEREPARSEPADAFSRLSPALRYHIVNSLGFTSLRPVQESTAQAICDGANCVVLAPTAGGKTEAAFLPLLSLMDAESWSAPSVVYLSPIKALLNNQESRLERLSGLIGRRAFKWHGDVGSGERKRFLADPADILMTTPESLEVMMMSTRVPSRRLFASLRAVVIDEVHAFAADDRGAHLCALLERLSRFCGRDVQRIGLSATVGNPEDISRWLQGSSRRRARLVRSSAPSSVPLSVSSSAPSSVSSVEADVTLDFVGTVSNAARVIAAMYRGGKRLVFADSRRKVERLGEALRAAATGSGGGNTQVLVTHSSLSADERKLAETAFNEGTDCVIIATSTMELGIDIGDLDAVFQIDAPPSVASFLQRMGRTGRRPGTRANCTLLCTKDEDLAICAALLRLWRTGYVEPVEPERRAYHVLAQQLMALAVQEAGIPITDWWAWVAGAAPFAGVTADGRTHLLTHMLEADILHADGGRLSLGVRGEKLYGRRHFEALYAVFQAPPMLRVYWGSSEIGLVDAFFMQQQPAAAQAFVLAGRPWRVHVIDWQRGRVLVSPAPSGRHLSWHGPPKLLARGLCQAVRDVIISPDMDAEWSRRARDKLSEYRTEHAFCHDTEQPLVPARDTVTWYTFWGGRVNNLLARMLEEKLGQTVTPGNFHILFKGDAARSDVAVKQAIAELTAPGAITDADARRHAASCARGRLSKFQPCLPEALELEFLAHRLIEYV